MRVKNISIFIAIMLFGIIGLQNDAKSQNTTRLREVGQWRLNINTNSIINPERAKRSIVASFNPDTIGGGGSFGDNYFGFGAAYAFALNKDASLRLPIGLEFVRYSAAERLYISSLVTQRYEHSLNILTLTSNVEYDVLSFYDGTGNIYVGAGIDANYVFGRGNSTETSYVEQPQLDNINERSKDDAFRIGGRITTGLQAEFIDNIRFDISASLMSLNLLQLNETEGGLMHPITSWPDGDEQAVVTYRFNFGIIFVVFD